MVDATDEKNSIILKSNPLHKRKLQAREFRVFLRRNGRTPFSRNLTHNVRKRVFKILKAIGSLGRAWEYKTHLICDSFFVNSFTGLRYGFLSEALTRHHFDGLLIKLSSHDYCHGGAEFHNFREQSAR